MEERGEGITAIRRIFRWFQKFKKVPKVVSPNHENLFTKLLICIHFQECLIVSFERAAKRQSSHFQHHNSSTTKYTWDLRMAWWRCGDGALNACERDFHSLFFSSAEHFNFILILVLHNNQVAWKERTREKRWNNTMIFTFGISYTSDHKAHIMDDERSFVAFFSVFLSPQHARGCRKLS